MSFKVLSKQEKKVLRKICSGNKYYMKPIVKRINQWVASQKNIKEAWLLVLNQLHDIIRASQIDVEILLDQKVQQGKIENKNQAIKSIAGNAFSNALIYIFLVNKCCKNIPEWMFITSQLSSVPNFRQSININIQNEVQKPDMDIVIYANNNIKQKHTPESYIILSLKTSLRERAAQTYKWKLLMEVALHSPELCEKYNISYRSSVVPIICFATTNFYNEINNPQQRGMLKFFDRSFIAKEIIDFTEDAFIYPLSNLIPFAIEKLSNPYVQLSLF
ncbi:MULTISPECIES: BsaWI family type II restriction enzyme [unclassified Thermosynechococcus]|uniref:BsaWI family type II restriction enzyme n=1 Tax=unclassified Thermosynechococcus TaxID=2622553 RepID=UPI00267190BC|nr:MULTISPECIES: BsaWI family type II restriction enzyme [unclassified Thermosynechococcus]WKT86042.1 BsaWI family type II restriction enzyme [Thermosynechococcus sp. JY1339]WNC54987.1 BsaWI family type II restriction enzyme [Thermosynechococcus sp. JY1331]